eukprot:6729315-Alexandrium_andersonii.AAC.1
MGIHVLSKACTDVQPSKQRAKHPTWTQRSTKQTQCATHPNAHTSCNDIASIQRGAPSMDTHNIKNTMQHAQ